MARADGTFPPARASMYMEPCARAPRAYIVGRESSQVKRLSLLVVLISLIVLAAACGTPAPTATPSIVPTVVPTAVKPPAPTAPAPTATPSIVPTVVPTAVKPPAPTAPAATTIFLPDGTKCDFAGKGATLAFDGKRLNYTCGAADVGLLGNMAKAGTGYTVERVTLARKDNAWVIGKSETITMEIATIDLADGTTCANAGKGATLSFDGKRLNYTCGTANEVGLIGDLQLTTEVFTAERATIARENNAWVLKASVQAPISTLRAAR